ncbi:MAG: excinuclease ABC subunit UvrC [Deltaproteobacteria bacterium]|nr:MAG: excinuclease ABC subunit UvrC [Deltaproteobacteria bacterium]
MARRTRDPAFVPRIQSADDLAAAVERLPDAPGVYIMRDRKGGYLYVGKATRIRARVRQYFSGHDTRRFVPRLAELVGDVETIVTESEKQALLLENNLIKRLKPRFNVQLRDDKNFLVLRLDPTATWPRLELVRRIKRDGAFYFGPYPSARAARATLRVVNRHFRLRTCTDFVLRTRKRPCLQYHIERCPAPCVLDVDRERYNEAVRDVALFLRGEADELIRSLETRMKAAADALEFERAATLRDQIANLQSVLAAQEVVSERQESFDAVGVYREGGQLEFTVLEIRGGRVTGHASHSERGMEFPTAEVLAGFLGAHYGARPIAVPEILLPEPLDEDDRSALEAWLTEQAGRTVRISVPRRGRRLRILRLAERNAAANFATRRNRREDQAFVLERLAARLGLSRPPHRIECYDISHTQGSEPRASLVVFQDGEPDRAAYRTFRIRGTGGEPGQNDDFASMYEVLSRRIARAGEDAEAKRWPLPDLIVVDGGKGQLARALAALSDLGVPVGPEGVEVVALAKERRTLRPTSHRTGAGATRILDAAPGAALRAAAVAAPPEDAYEVRPERVYVPGKKDPILLRPGTSERLLMERIRDEAHRFAITAHRKARRRAAVRSRLSEIPGIGPKLERTLLARFGSLRRIAAASAEDLCAVPGIGPKTAHTILAALGRDVS